ncbi:MAG: hypothetical protein Q8R28_19890 [Dehalococcoidia bacterium]|nr:hypothetical protein [Dehalococcoidia bacterium]
MDGRLERFLDTRNAPTPKSSHAIPHDVRQDFPQITSSVPALPIGYLSNTIMGSEPPQFGIDGAQVFGGNSASRQAYAAPWRQHNVVVSGHRRAHQENCSVTPAVSKPDTAWGTDSEKILLMSADPRAETASDIVTCQPSPWVSNPCLIRSVMVLPAFELLPRKGYLGPANSEPPLYYDANARH